MIDNEEALLLLNQVELHLRNVRGELNELGHSIDAIRKAF